MALVFNNVTVPQSGNVIYNGTSLSVVKHGNTQVWKRAVTRSTCYNNGAGVFRIYRGMGYPTAIRSGPILYYRNQTGHETVFSDGGAYSETVPLPGGGSVITNWPVDLSAVSS